MSMKDLLNKMTELQGTTKEEKVTATGKKVLNENTGVTDYEGKKGPNRVEALKKYANSKDPKDAASARKAGATQTELKKAKEEVAESAKPSLKSMFNSLLAEAEQVTIQPAQQNTQVIKQGDKTLGTVTNPNLAQQIKQSIGKGEMSLAGDELNEVEDDYDGDDYDHDDGSDQYATELYGLHLGDVVKANYNGKTVIGKISELHPTYLEVELELTGRNEGKTVIVDVRETEYIDNLNEAVNKNKIIKDLESGMSMDALVGKHLNKKTSNKDEILKIVRDYKWEKQKKKADVTETKLTEKAKSKSQQQAAGAALAAKRGDAPKSKLKGASKEMAKMPDKELEKFAKTKHKGLPEKKQKTDEALEKDGPKRGDINFKVPTTEKGREYSAKKAKERADMNKKNDPGAAKKGLALSVVDREKAANKAMKKTNEAAKRNWGYHIVSQQTGNSVPNTPKFTTRKEAQSYLKNELNNDHNKYAVDEFNMPIKKTNEAAMPTHDSDFGAGLGAGRSKTTLENKTMKKTTETKKKNDGNLANNAKPYDKVTRGDVIAGRLGKDEMGGKKKAASDAKKKKTVKEGETKELDMDLKDKTMSDAEFKKKYKKTKAEMRKELSAKQQVNELSPDTLSSYHGKALGQAKWAGGVAKSLDRNARDSEARQYHQSANVDPNVKYNKKAEPYADLNKKRLAGAKKAREKGANPDSLEYYDYMKKGRYGTDNDGNEISNPATNLRDRTKNKQVNESMNKNAEAARLLGKAHALAKDPFACKYESGTAEAQSYLDGYKEGLDECYGSGSMGDSGMSQMPAMVPGMDAMGMDQGFDDFEEDALIGGSTTFDAAGTDDYEDEMAFEDWNDDFAARPKDWKPTSGQAYDASKRALGIANRLPKDQRDKWNSRTMSQMNKFRAEKDKAFEAWDNQLNALLNEGKMKDLDIDMKEMSDAEFKKEHGKSKAEMRKNLSGSDKKKTVNEGVTVAINKDIENAPDSVTVTAQGDEADQLLAMIKQAGMGLFGGDDEQTGSYGAPAAPEADVFISQKSDIGDHDSMMALLQKMTAGSQDYADEESGDDEHVHGHPDAACGDVAEPEMVMDEDESEDEMEFQVAEEADSEEAETTADEDAEAEEDKALAGADSGDEEELDESYELTEWANDANNQRSEDDSYYDDIDFMTKVISGGLNNQKQDQTTLPHTKVTVDDLSDWKKLSGLK
jgi:hypothetical protein